jgi:hypothetical protein
VLQLCAWVSKEGQLQEVLAAPQQQRQDRASRVLPLLFMGVEQALVCVYVQPGTCGLRKGCKEVLAALQQQRRQG